MALIRDGLAQCRFRRRSGRIPATSQACSGGAEGCLRNCQQLPLTQAHSGYSKALSLKRPCEISRGSRSVTDSTGHELVVSSGGHQMLNTESCSVEIVDGVGHITLNQPDRGNPFDLRFTTEISLI